MLGTALALRALRSRQIVTPAMISAAVGLDMADWWEPTAAGFLNHVPKAHIVQALCQAGAGLARDGVENMKKSVLVTTAEGRLRGTRPATRVTSTIKAQVSLCDVHPPDRPGWCLAGLASDFPVMPLRSDATSAREVADGMMRRPSRPTLDVSNRFREAIRCRCQEPPPPTGHGF